MAVSYIFICGMFIAYKKELQRKGLPVLTFLEIPFPYFLI